MGRPTIREQPMTAAERQRRHRERLHQGEESNVDLFTMTNLYPRRTGLPMTVWVSSRGRARQAARIKVNMTHGNRMTIGNTAIVRLQPAPRVISGQLSYLWAIVRRRPGSALPMGYDQQSGADRPLERDDRWRRPGRTLAPVAARLTLSQ